MSFEKIGKRETLPEKVYKIIKESILKGVLKGGDLLPTEPELEKQFGVSRAVIRDAVRMLKAQGLIIVKHGKGMYVSQSQIHAFTDALLTSLRREEASAWDVEQFEQIFLPQVFALASQNASEEALRTIRDYAGDYIGVYKELTEAEKSSNALEISRLSELSKETFHSLMDSIFESTGNKMIKLIGQVLITMRKWRTISDVNTEKYDLVAYEKAVITRFVQAIESRDPEKASAIIKDGISLDQTVITILQSTPVGTSPEIPGDAFVNAYKHLFE
jgi:DNA-binding FadR family transcriptional regulator